MLTEGLSVYDSWSLRSPILCPPSRLYSLPPANLGTADSESLTGYVARLAQAHNVTVAALFALEIAPLMQRSYFENRIGEFRTRRVVVSSFRHVVRTANGIGKTATDLTCAIEALTLRSDIDLLTMRPWANIFAKCGLLRPSHAACFSCYEEWRIQGKVICEPLLWALEAVSLCPKHGRPLRRQCPFCAQLLLPLTSHSRPGHCSRCGEWLGTLALTPLDRETLRTDEWKQAWWMANAAGELIAAAPGLDSPPTKERVSKAITVQAHRFANSKRAPLARLFQMNNSTLGFWQRGDTIPEFGRFLKMCFHLDMSPLQFLSGHTVQEERPAVLSLSQPQMSAPKRNRHRWDETRRLLEAALHEDPPPLIKDMAKHTGCSLTSLQHHHPSLYQAIAKRRHDFVKRCICDLRPKLEAILTERPPPSFKDVAQRFGHARGTLRTYFPDLIPLLVKRFLEHQRTLHSTRRQRLESEIRQAALTLHRAGQYPSLQRISRHITQTDDLVGIEWASPLLREIRNELGIRGARQAVNFTRVKL